MPGGARRAPQKRQPDGMRVWLIVRDAILLVFGMSGLSYEAMSGRPVQTELLPIFTFCLGLPPFLRIPRKGKRNYDDHDSDDWPEGP